MGTIPKRKLAHEIGMKLGIHPTDSKLIIQEFLDHVSNYLINGDRIEIRDFGVFEVVIRKQKIGRNPKEASVSIVIPERKIIKFKPGKKLKKLVVESKRSKK